MSEGILGKASKRHLAYGSAAASVIFFSSAGLAFLTQLLIARILGPESFGIYAYVLAWMSVLAYCAALGFQVALLRFVSVYESKNAWSLLRGVIQYSERRAGIVGALVIVIGITGVLIRGNTIAPELSNTFVVGFLLVPAWAFLWMRAAAIRAFGGVVTALVPERIMRDGLLLAFVLFASLSLKWTLDASTVMTVTLASTVLALCMAHLAMRRLRPNMIDTVVAEYDVKAWRKAALPLLVVGAMDALFNRTGVLMLGWVGETKSAGIYGLAFSIAFLSVMPRTAVETLFAPAIARLYAARQFAELQTLVVRAASWSMCAAASIAIVLAVMAEYLLAWFGPEYVEGANALRILLVGQVISASAGSQIPVLAMTGHERNSAVILALSAAANIIISFMMITQFGLLGAAWATMISIVLWNGAMAVFIRRRLDLWPGVYGVFRRR
ncbi:MAG: oligosaccharide flippase family protein [Woeseiaceae bacterium]